MSSHLLYIADPGHGFSFESLDHAAISNPCDLTGDATEELFQRTLQAVLDDPGVDGAIVILTPVSPGADVKIAEATAGVARASEKTTFFCFLGVSDFTARLLGAVSGLLLVMTPLLLRKWLTPLDCGGCDCIWWLCAN